MSENEEMKGSSSTKRLASQAAQDEHQRDTMEESDIHNIVYSLDKMQIAVKTLTDIREADLDFFQNKYDSLLKRFEGIEQSLPSKVDLIAQLSELRQKLYEIQAMEASLREASLQTIRSSFQSEATIVEQKISLGSQQRYSALETKIDKADLSIQGKISETKTSLESQVKILEASFQGKLDKLEGSIEAKIRGQVMQGIMWGMGLVGGIISIVFTIVHYASK